MDIIPQLVANSIIAGSIYALVALGFNLIYGATKFFNLAHGVIAAIGGYAVFFLAKTLGFGISVSVVAGILLAEVRYPKTSRAFSSSRIALSALPKDEVTIKRQR